ncbi:hypothetical protein B0H13DRAFT_1871262 [Mycena leptocephala]|nr:hypothetical protein B0H13DRAFT_1871262 [Mycena leptocephala]
MHQYLGWTSTTAEWHPKTVIFNYLPVHDSGDFPTYLSILYAIQNINGAEAQQACMIGYGYRRHGRKVHHWFDYAPLFCPRGSCISRRRSATRVPVSHPARRANTEKPDELPAHACVRCEGVAAVAFSEDDEGEVVPLSPTAGEREMGKEQANAARDTSVV